LGFTGRSHEDFMTDQVTPEGGALPSDANASPPVETRVEPKGSEAGSSPAADTGEKKAEPSKDGRDLRISELTRRLRQAERDRERLLKLAEERGQPAPQPAQPTQTKKTLKDFNYDDGAYAEHLRQEVRTEAAEAARQEALRQRESEVTALRREKFEERVATFATAHPDYGAVVEGEWACSKQMAEAIEDSDEGPALAYYLAQNPEVARQMSRLSAVQAGRELARLEDRLVSERKKAAEKPVTQAPAPPPKIDGSNPGNVENDPLKMSDAQFSKWFRKNVRKR
jgi:hypothetical protein